MRAVVRTVHLPVKKSVLEDSMPRDVGSVVLMDVGLGVTGQHSNIWGEVVSSPRSQSIGYFWSGTRRDFVV